MVCRNYKISYAYHNLAVFFYRNGQLGQKKFGKKFLYKS